MKSLLITLVAFGIVVTIAVRMQPRVHNRVSQPSPLPPESPAVILSPPKSSAEQVADILAKFPNATQPDERAKLRSTLANSDAKGNAELFIDLLQQSADDDVIAGAQGALARVADAALCKQLVAAYEQGSDEAAIRIARTLELVRATDAVPVLIQAIDAPGIPIEDRLSLAAMRALTSIGSPAAVRALAARLNRANDTDAAVLSLALTTVARPGSAPEIIAIAKGMRENADTPRTRAAATLALRNYPITETAESLQALAADLDLEVATAARKALSHSTTRR